MKRIEQYDNFREFLRDYFEDRKRRFSFFSNRYFCRKAGISSPSLYQEIVEGKRNLTDKTVESFIKGLGLTVQDADFFRTLVLFNQSKTIKEQELYLAQLKKLRQKVSKEVIPADHYEYFAHWYNPAVRELACLIDWKDDYELLAKFLNPPIKKKEAKESIELLLKLGFLTKDDEGKYHQNSPAIFTGNNAHLGVRSLNKQIANLGTDAIENIPPSERYISSMTLGISKDAFHQIEQEIEEFKDRIRRIVDDDKKSDSVYNMNIHLFPVSRKTWGKE